MLIIGAFIQITILILMFLDTYNLILNAHGIIKILFIMLSIAVLIPYTSMSITMLQAKCYVFFDILPA